MGAVRILLINLLWGTLSFIMIKILPSVEDGHVLLCVRNEFQHSSTVVQILRGPGACSNLLEREIPLSQKGDSGSKIILDVTKAMRRGLPDDFEGTCELLVICEPEDQPCQPGRYKICINNSVITAFESV